MFQCCKVGDYRSLLQGPYHHFLYKGDQASQEPTSGLGEEPGSAMGHLQQLANFL